MEQVELLGLGLGLLVDVELGACVLELLRRHLPRLLEATLLHVDEAQAALVVAFLEAIGRGVEHWELSAGLLLPLIDGFAVEVVSWERVVVRLLYPRYVSWVDGVHGGQRLALAPS